MQKRILQLEHQLYKANAKMEAAKKRSEEKNEIIACLRSEILRLRQKNEQQQIISSAQDVLSVS